MSGEYICPMHPSVRATKADSCPFCGMALEPLKATLTDEKNPELVDFTKRFWFGSAFALPVVVLEMGSHLLTLDFIKPSINYLIQFLFSLPVIGWAGWPFFVRGVQSVKNRSLNMFSLISLGVFAAFCYSTVALFLPQLFPMYLLNKHSLVPVYFEAACVIIILVLLGQLLEVRAREFTGNAIKNLLQLTPKTAWQITLKGDKKICLHHIKPGMQLRIKPGEKVPADGKVIEGETTINEAMLTGEPMPSFKNSRAKVHAGTMNEGGSIVIEVTKAGEQTLLAHIIDLVAKAQRSRAPIARMADTLAAYFVPIVIVISLFTFLIWALLTQQGLNNGIIHAVSVLIIACPCALGLATPMSIMVGIGLGAKQGIFIKDAQSLELLNKIDTLFIDKTGTLTKGSPDVVTYYSNDKQDDLLSKAASLEKMSEHPIANCIVKFAENKNIKFSAVSQFNSVAGKGVTGYINNQFIIVGSQTLMKTYNIDISPFAKHTSQHQAKGGTLIFIAENDKAIGFIVVNDLIKENAKENIIKLSNHNIKVIMLTGDTTTAAKKIAQQLHIDTYYGDLLPNDKQKMITDCKKKGHIVAMAGDGINDAPALAAANISIAMGTGTDIAIHTAGITFLKGDLSHLIKSLTLSQKITRNIRQNLTFAFLYNILAIPTAAGLFYPLGFTLSPMLAAAAMSLSSLCIIINALRLQ